MALLRFLNRVPISMEGRLHINQGYVDQLRENQRIIVQHHASDMNKHTLTNTMAFVKQNEGTVGPDLSDNTQSNLDYAIHDALFYNYLLLDIASVWHHLRFENTLVAMEMLCVSWNYKCNDIFDSCFELTRDYWRRYVYALFCCERMYLIHFIL